MKNFKRVIQPLFFILLTSLLAGGALLYFSGTQGGAAIENAEAELRPEREAAALKSSETLAYKNETVYVLLDPEGRVVEQSIVNRIYQCGGEPAEMIKDYGSYREISNMTSEAEPVLQENMVLWDSELLQEGDIYYEGISDKSLPVDFNIDYYLDGVATEATALPGKSGELKIVIRVENKLAVEGAVPYLDYYGKTAQKYDLNYIPLLVQGTYSVDLNRFSQIRAGDGVGIITGQNMNISFMAFPYPEAEIVMTMQGDEIELSQIMMMIIPQLPPIPEVDMEDDFIELINGISAISEGLTELYGGADQLYQGFSGFITEGKDMLSGLEPLFELIEEFAELAEGYTSEDLEEVLRRLEDLLRRIDELPDPGDWNFGNPDEAEPGAPPAWDEILEQIPSDLFDDIHGNAAELEELLEHLRSFYETLSGLEGQIDDLDTLREKAEEAYDMLSALPGALDELVEAQKMIRDGIGEVNNKGVLEIKKGLVEGVNEMRFGQAKIELMRSLAEGFKSHADNENNANSSVQFILQTETVKGQEQESGTGDQEKEENGQNTANRVWYSKLWSRFVQLFASFS